MTAKHIALHGQPVPDALYESMHALVEKTEVYRNPFFHPQFINAVSQTREDVHVFWEEDEKGLRYFWTMQINKARIARGIGGPFADRNGPVLRNDVALDIETFLADNNLRKFITNGFVHSDLAITDSFETELNCEAFIETSYEDFYQVQKKEHNSQFKRWRRAKRQLEEEFESVEFNFDDPSDKNFEKILEMKQNQYLETGLHNVLGPDWTHALFRELRQSQGGDFRLRVITLTVDGIMVAGEINLQSRDTLHGWIVVYDRDYRKYCLGYLLVLYILEQLKPNGLSYYDFGPGSEHYAKYLTNLRKPLGVGVIRPDNKSVSLNIVIEKLWRSAENRLPEKLGRLFQKIRRRSDQIFATEVDFMPRVKGLLYALKSKR